MTMTTMPTTTPAAPNAVSVSGLTKRFGRISAVDDITLDIPAGGVYGLLGPNGSGKTTFLSLLAGFLRPTAGQIALLGQTGPAGHRRALRQTGALIERPTFWPHLSCRDNLRCLQGLYPPSGHDYTSTGRSNDYAPADSSPDYAPAGRSADYTPTGRSNDYAPAGRSNDYPPTGRSADYPPTGRSANYAPAGRAGDSDSDSVETLLETVGLAGDFAARKFAACSTGMKQRLGIAAALLGSPTLIILDEPTNGLDPAGIVEIRALIRSLASDRRRTIILASHLLNEVEQVCDRVGVLARGRLLYTGPVAEMGAPARVHLRTTDDPRAAALLQAAGWQLDAPAATAGSQTAPNAAEPQTSPTAAGSQTTPTAAGSPTAPTATEPPTAPTAAGTQAAPNAARSQTAPNAAEPQTAPTAAGTQTAPTAAGLQIAVTPGQEWQITRHLAEAGVYVAEMRPVSGALEAGFMEVIAATASDT